MSTTPLATEADDEEDLVSDEDILDMILHPEISCYGVADGWSEDDWHEDPDGFTLDDLLRMWEDSEERCPLHVRASYPAGPVGVVGAQLTYAHDQLQKWTEAHTGRPSEWDDGHTYYATSAELQDLWRDYPHAQPTFEAWAMAGEVRIEVVE